MSRVIEEVAPVAVIGMGNVLLGDDGFGPSVIATLADEWELPDGVELIDAGTPGLDLAALLCGRNAVIFVDCVAASASPGELRLFRGAELSSALVMMPRVSPHDPALAEALAISRLAGGPAAVLLVGAVPQNVDVGVGLGDAMMRAVRNAADMIVAELARLGLAPRWRRTGGLQTPWWWRGTSAAAAPVAGRGEV